MLSYIEMKQCISKAFAVIDIKEFNKTDCIIISPDFYPIKHNIYVYPVESRNVHHTSDYAKNAYVSAEISEHIANAVLSPIKSAKNKLKEAKSSYSPINSLYSAASDAMNITNVMSLQLSNSGKYTIEYHAEDNISTFIANNFIYIL